MDIKIKINDDFSHAKTIHELNELLIESISDLLIIYNFELGRIDYQNRIKEEQEQTI